MDFESWRGHRYSSIFHESMERNCRYVTSFRRSFGKTPMRGVIEIRGPYYSIFGRDYIQGLMERSGTYIDGLKFAGGSHSLMKRETVDHFTSQAHKYGIYVSTGGWADHVLKQGPRFFAQYVQDCKDLGFDIIEFSPTHLNMGEQDLLRLIRMVKNVGLKVKPEFLFESEQGHSTIEALLGDQRCQNVEPLIKQAERCLEAGADMIMIEAEGLTQNVHSWRTDVIAEMIERIGLEKLMFEAADPRVCEWFLGKYGDKVNLLVDHSHVVRVQTLRSCINYL